MVASALISILSLFFPLTSLFSSVVYSLLSSVAVPLTRSDGQATSLKIQGSTRVSSFHALLCVTELQNNKEWDSGQVQVQL